MKNSALAIVLATSSFVMSCKQPVVFENFSGFVQGTTYSIVYEKTGNLDPATLRKNTEKILADFDMSLSLYKDSSILSRINNNEEVIPDKYFVEVFNQSKKISEMTGGLFDVTVGPLVKAWGFGPDEHKNFSEAKRDSLMQLIGMDKVSLVDGKLIKSDPGIMLDFNAIAQGYSVDVICDYFDSLKINDYLIEIGGEVRVKGSKNGVPWKIGIDRPEDNNNIPGNQLEAIIQIEDRALATSGNYRKFYIENGIKYSHTINPKTGYPAKNQLLSATILTDKCSFADGFATACMVMGKEKAIQFIESNKLDGYLIFSDDNGNFKTWMSEGLKNSLTEETGN